MFTLIDKARENELWETKIPRKIPDTISDVSTGYGHIYIKSDKHPLYARKRGTYNTMHTTITHRHTGGFPKQSLPTRPSFRTVAPHEVTVAAVEGTPQ